jgi:hypothetical protein
MYYCLRLARIVCRRAMSKRGLLFASIELTTFYHASQNEFIL